MIWTGQTPDETSPVAVTMTWDVYLDFHKTGVFTYSRRKNSLENMGSHVLSSNRVLGNTFLVNAHEVEDLQSTLVDFATAIADNTNNDFLPPFGTPGFGTVPGAEVSNVFDDTK
jgi:hypothetical protein